jgi:hypothetical protein
LLPMDIIQEALAMSLMLLVIAPEPNVLARPANVGACQTRAQLSTLLVYSTARANFWAV